MGMNRHKAVSVELPDLRRELGEVEADAPFVKRGRDGVYRQRERARPKSGKHVHEFSESGFCLGCGRTPNEIALDEE